MSTFSSCSKPPQSSFYSFDPLATFQSHSAFPGCNQSIAPLHRLTACIVVYRHPIVIDFMTLDLYVYLFTIVIQSLDLATQLIALTTID